MQFQIKKSFEKDTNKINDKKILQEIYNVITNIEKASSIREIKNIKKMQGYKNFYRIKTGNYRIGLNIENKVVTIVRFLHRKEIYKYFP